MDKKPPAKVESFPMKFFLAKPNMKNSVYYLL